jgi:hypothetical protein
MYGSKYTKENMWLLLTVHVLDFKYILLSALLNGIFNLLGFRAFENKLYFLIFKLETRKKLGYENELNWSYKLICVINKCSLKIILFWYHFELCPDDKNT